MFDVLQNPQNKNGYILIEQPFYGLRRVSFDFDFTIDGIQKKPSVETQLVIRNEDISSFLDWPSVTDAAQTLGWIVEKSE